MFPNVHNYVWIMSYMLLQFTNSRYWHELIINLLFFKYGHITPYLASTGSHTCSCHVCRCWTLCFISANEQLKKTILDQTSMYMSSFVMSWFALKKRFFCVNVFTAKKKWSPEASILCQSLNKQVCYAAMFPKMNESLGVIQQPSQ